MIHGKGKSNQGMSFTELLEELKRLRVQMRYFRKITFGLLNYNNDYLRLSRKKKVNKENELLDIEYDQIVRMQKRDQLPLFDKLDVS